MSTNYPGDYSDNYPNIEPQQNTAYGSAPMPLPVPVSVTVQKKKYTGQAIIIILVLVAIGLGVLRYYGPVLVTQSYLNDIYSYKFSDALNLICPAEQAQMQGELQSASILTLFKVNIDTSHISYSIQNETLSDATVAVTGSISVSSIGSSNVNGLVTLQTNGIWWCISSQTNGPPA